MNNGTMSPKAPHISGYAILPRSEQPRVLISIVNYKVSDYTKQAIRSLMESRDDVGHFRLYVIDNDSQDGSFEILSDFVRENGWMDSVSVLAAPKNGGFFVR